MALGVLTRNCWLADLVWAHGPWELCRGGWRGTGSLVGQQLLGGDMESNPGLVSGRSCSGDVRRPSLRRRREPGEEAGELKSGGGT